MKINEVNKLTIVPIDSVVIVNNIPKFNIDLSSMDKRINAVQWSDGKGEIEYLESEDVIYNQPISSIEEYQHIIDLWENTIEEIPEIPPEKIPTPEMEEEILKLIREKFPDFDPNNLPTPE